jgi:hypothetical protein
VSFFCGATPRNREREASALNAWRGDDGVIVRYELRRDGFASVSGDGTPFATRWMTLGTAGLWRTRNRLMVNLAAPGRGAIDIWVERRGSGGQQQQQQQQQQPMCVID